MGTTKTKDYTDQQNQMAIIAKAMGHPARIAIIDYIISVDSCICNDIVEELPLSQSTVSQHLKELKLAGLIQGNIEGKSMCYCLNPTFFNQFNNYLNAISNSIQQQTNCKK